MTFVVQKIEGHEELYITQVYLQSESQGTAAAAAALQKADLASTPWLLDRRLSFLQLLFYSSHQCLHSEGTGDKFFHEVSSNDQNHSKS